MKEKIFQEIKTLFNEFNEASTDIDFAFFLFADALYELEKLRILFDQEGEKFDCADFSNSLNLLDSLNFKEKLMGIEKQLSVAQSKFKTNRISLGEGSFLRYRDLIDKIKLRLEC